MLVSGFHVLLRESRRASGGQSLLQLEVCRELVALLLKGEGGRGAYGSCGSGSQAGCERLDADYCRDLMDKRLDFARAGAGGAQLRELGLDTRVCGDVDVGR